MPFPSGSASNSAMLKMRIELWHFAGAGIVDKSCTLFISGYFSPTPNWGNQSVQTIASDEGVDFSVRFGFVGTVPCIWIGELNTAWSYPRLFISEFMASFDPSGTPTSRYATGWNISVQSSFDTVEDTFSNNLPLASGIKGGITASNVTEDTTHRFATDTEKTTWNAKQAALVSGTNIKTVNGASLLGTGNISIAGGGGSSLTWSEATIDFGTGNNEASVAVIDQASILTTSKAFAFVMADDTTIDHTANDHRYLSTLAHFTCGTPVEGVGFTIYATSIHKLTGTFKVRWAWGD